MKWTWPTGHNLPIPGLKDQSNKYCPVCLLTFIKGKLNIVVKAL